MTQQRTATDRTHDPYPHPHTCERGIGKSHFFSIWSAHKCDRCAAFLLASTTANAWQLKDLAAALTTWSETGLIPGNPGEWVEPSQDELDRLRRIEEQIVAPLTL